jgi:hypothetical protein
MISSRWSKSARLPIGGVFEVRDSAFIEVAAGAVAVNLKDAHVSFLAAGGDAPVHGIDEVQVDAATGEVVSVQHETPKDEAAEKKGEH